jgi:serine/threonine-protein kinase
MDSRFVHASSATDDWARATPSASLRDVARALAYAHEHGVVHRDVKPDNVLLSSEAAVVTDFGIAKAFTVALSETDGSIHTDGVIGTPAYMAPEQARGDAATDHRADVYSFGCLAYEVFTGESPFAGSTTLELIEARSDAAPVPRVEGRSEIPATLAKVISRCLEKDPAARPQSAAQLLEALDAARSVDGVATPAPRGRKLLPYSFAVLLVAALVVWYVASRPARGGPVTVAVLPLLSSGTDSVQATLAEGLSDELATALVGIPWVRVMSRRGAENFRGKTDIDPRAIGKALGARYLVTGSLREIGGRQSVTARLVNSEDGSVLWADEFERPKELAALRDRIVNAIGDSLKSKAGRYSASKPRTPAATHRANNDAYILYVIGKRELNQRNQDLAGSIAHFRQAIALDSLSAEAWSGLSLALALAPIYHGASADSLAPIITANARRALRLDSRLAWPHIALGPRAPAKSSVERCRRGARGSGRHRPTRRRSACAIGSSSHVPWQACRCAS